MDQAPALPLPFDVSRLLPLAAAAGGYAAFGAVASLVEGADLRLVSAPLISGAVAVIATLPTVLVAHPWLGMSATPAQVAAALIDGWVRAGTLALALAPVLFFFAASRIVGLVYALLTLGFAAVGLLRGGMSLRALEPTDARISTLALGWACLTAGIGGVVFLNLVGD